MKRTWDFADALSRSKQLVRARVVKANGASLTRVYRGVMLWFFGIHRLDRGVYGVPGKPGCVVAAVRVSRGIICLESALYLHGLLADEPWESWLCIHDKDWKPKQSLVYPVEIVRTTLRFDESELIRRPDGVLYTSVPRTIVDFHRYRHRFLPGRAAEVLKRALESGKTTLDEVRKTAARLRIRFP